jgi:hypothetical protein
MPETAEVTQVLQAIGRNEEGAAKKLLPLAASARRSALKKISFILAQLVSVCRMRD